MNKTVLLSALFTAFALFQGCAPIKTNPDMISVESYPSGADIYVMGKKIGIAPLEIRQRDVFPPTYSPDQQPLYGIIVLRKTGCKDFTQPADIDAYRYGIKAKLECGEQKPVVTAPIKQKEENTSIETRLRQLRELQDKGLVTDDEAKATRKRILEGL